MNQQLTGDCQKPGCERNATETYEGENGNTLRLCETHYYRLVSGGSPTGIGTADPLFTGTEPHQIEPEPSTTVGAGGIADPEDLPDPHPGVDDLEPPEDVDTDTHPGVSDMIDDDALWRPPSPDEPFWTVTVSPRPM